MWLRICMSVPEKIKTPTIKIRFIHNLRFDDFLDDIFQSDDAHDFVERISISFIIDPLHDSQMRFPFTVPEKDTGASGYAV